MPSFTPRFDGIFRTLLGQSLSPKVLDLTHIFLQTGEVGVGPIAGLMEGSLAENDLTFHSSTSQKLKFLILGVGFLLLWWNSNAFAFTLLELHDLFVMAYK